MKKLLLCASLIALSGANAEALTIINETPKSIHIFVTAYDQRHTQIHHMGVYVRKKIRDSVGTGIVDITQFPHGTEEIRFWDTRMSYGDACVFEIDAHQTLAQANKKTIKVAYPEEGGNLKCTVLYTKPSSPKPTK